MLIGALTSGLRDRFQFWEIGVALVFIAVVLLFPQGLIGIFAPLERRFGRRPAPAPGITAPARTDPGGAAQLVVDGVHVRVGEVTILDDSSFALERPGIYCVIGPNGAGKTSTFNMLSGELAAQAGRVGFDGRPLARLTTHRIVRLGIGRKFQIPSVFPALSIADNLAIALWSARATRLDLLRPRLRRWSGPVLEELARALSVPRRCRTHGGRALAR